MRKRKVSGGLVRAQGHLFYSFSAVRLEKGRVQFISCVRPSFLIIYEGLPRSLFRAFVSSKLKIYTRSGNIFVPGSTQLMQPVKIAKNAPIFAKEGVKQVDSG